MLYDPFVRGSHPVGVRTTEIIDHARAGRRILVEIWYPATEAHRGQDLAEATCDRFTIADGLPEGVQRAVREAAPASGRWPLVLHLHCAFTHRRDASLLGPHLASHGYVVASPDFPGDTIADALINTRASDEETIANRPKDALLALNAMLAGSDPIDHERVGTCGISLGGWTALRLNSLDRRPQASFVAAPSWGTRGPFPQTKLQTSHVRVDDWGRAVPEFLLAGERDMLVVLDDLRELYEKLCPPKRFAVLAGASHFHWAERAETLYNAFRALWESGAIPAPGMDTAALARSTPPFSELAPNEHATETLQALCLSHMDAHLKGSVDARTFLDGDIDRTFATRGIKLHVK